MNFKGIREDLLKISVNEFSSDYEVSVGDVELLEKTNEVPLSLIKQISKKSGYSVGELLKYDGTKALQDSNLSSDSIKKQITLFSFDKKKTVVLQFEDWLQANNQYLKCSNKVDEWTKDNIMWILNEYDNSLESSAQESQALTDKDICDYFEQLSIISQNEIVKLKYVLSDRNGSRSTIKNAVNLEVTRLIKEDSILEKTTNELLDAKTKHLKDVYELLLKMTSAAYIEKVIKSSIVEDNAYLETFINIKKACQQKQREFQNAVDSIVYSNDGLIKFYDTELDDLFAKSPELNGFSAANTYYRHFRFGVSHPDSFKIRHPEVTAEEREKRNKATGKRRIKDAAMDFAFDVLFPPKAIAEAFSAGNPKNMSKEVAKYIKEQKTLEDFYSQITYCYEVIVAASVFALKGIKNDWKHYFNQTIDLVQKDNRDLEELIEDETTKIFIAKAIKEAFKEA